MVRDRISYSVPFLRRWAAAPTFFLLACLAGGAGALGQAQRHPLDPPVPTQPGSPQHRSRLILRDGSYQTVLSYKVVGDRVHYRSAERNGQDEEIPLTLVDLPATQAWEQAHDPATAGSVPQQPTVLSPELAREEAARAALTPEIAKDLRLPEGNSVLVLDTFQGTPELVPLPQYGSDLNRETAHATLKKELNPSASAHDLFFVRGERSDIQVHVPDPVFYVRLESEKGAREDDGGGSFVVDTQGQAGKATPSGGSGQSGYVLQHLDVRQGARAVTSLRIGQLGTGKSQPGILEVREETLPGGVWKKLSPVQALEFGEYALIEILNERAINADVWDFGVHPTAKENEGLRPEPKRPAQLEHRRP